MMALQDGMMVWQRGMMALQDIKTAWQYDKTAQQDGTTALQDNKTALQYGMTALQDDTTVLQDDTMTLQNSNFLYVCCVPRRYCVKDKRTMDDINQCFKAVRTGKTTLQIIVGQLRSCNLTCQNVRICGFQKIPSNV